MPKGERDRQKRTMAQAVLSIEDAQRFLAPIWALLKDDGRAWHELMNLPEPLFDPEHPEHVLTGEDVVSALLEGLDGVKAGIATISLALWDTTLEQLEHYR